MPPAATVTAAAPSARLGQLVGVAVICKLIKQVEVPTTTWPEVVQPLASVTVTMYISGDKLVIFKVVAPLLHAIEYGWMPPVGATVAVPSYAPSKLSSVPVAMAVNCVGDETLPESCTTQPSPSVMETEIAPAAKFCIWDKVAPLLQA